MARVSIRLPFVSTVVLIGLVGGITAPVAAEKICDGDCEQNEETVGITLQEAHQIPHPVDFDQPGVDDNTETAVSNEFLKAKKAFHTARQEIQAIKKGDESPVEDVPTFFESESTEDDESREDTTGDDELQEDEPSIQK